MFSFLRRMPIRLRLSIAYALLLACTIAAAGIYLLATVEAGLLQESDQALRLRAAHVEREIAPASGQALKQADVMSALADLAPQEEFSAPGIYVQVQDSQGHVLASSSNLPAGWLTAAFDTVAGSSNETGYVTVKAGQERVRIFALPVDSGGQVAGVIMVGESLHFLDLTLGRIRQLLLFAAAGAAAASLLIGWWLTGRALSPIASVTGVAHRIATTGRFQQRIEEPPARDEVGELVETFNEMLDRLEKSFLLQREFLADASHELRGPLTVIRGNLDLLNMNVSEEERAECILEVTGELERMSRLISDLLFLSEVDSREMVERVPVALDHLVARVWARAEGVDGGQHRLEFSCNDPAVVQGDGFRLEQMVWNLVENALRYTPAGRRVSVCLRAHSDVAELSVEDTGIGIPSDQLPHVFERFYRVDKARSREKGGAGLGLAIVKQVAEAHGGQVRVRSTPGEGTTFTVALPTVPSPKICAN